MKYTFTGETLIYKGKTLKRIKRLFDEVVGGFIESESNLSHDGNCFVYHDAKVFDQARVTGNASIYNNCEVYDQAIITDDAELHGAVTVSGFANIKDNAKLIDFVRVSDSATISGHTLAHGYCDIKGNTIVNDSHLDSNARVMGNARLDKSTMTGSAKVSDNAILIESSICCDSFVGGDAVVEKTQLPKGSIVTTSINDFKIQCPVNLKSADDYFSTRWQGVHFTFVEGGMSIDCKHMTDADQGVVPWTQDQVDERFANLAVYKAIIDPTNMTAMPEINLGKNAKWFICSLVKFSELLTMAELDALSTHFSFGLPAITDYNGRVQLWQFLKNKELTDATVWHECRVKILELLNARP